MQPKISVIIPCWHATEYFDRLYDSIQSQTFKDAEWIFVNDGDASQNEKLQAMAEKDSAIRVIWKENGGPSSARNVGIDAAKGEWIVFSDADDWFRPYYLESLYSAVKDSDADMAVGGFTEFRTVSQSYIPFFIHIDGDNAVALDTRSAILKIIKTSAVVFPWNKIYKTSIIKENNLKFDLTINIIEDGVFNTQYFCYCKKISLVKDCGYIYILMDSTSLVSVYHSEYGRVCKMVFLGYRNLLEINGFTPEEIDKLTETRAFGTAIIIILNAFRRNHPPFKQAVKEIREYVLQEKYIMRAVKEYKDRKDISSMEKIMAYLISTNSATLIVLIMKPIIWIRYKSPKFYYKIKSLFH